MIRLFLNTLFKIGLRVSLSRKKFIDILIKVLSFSILATLAFGIHKLFRQLSGKSRLVELPSNKIQSSTFVGKEFILLSNRDEAKVLSRQCPHLGCRLEINDKYGQIVCPCHGSRFDMEGRYVSGPAKKDMQQLTFKTKQNGNLQIYLDSL